MIRGATLPGVSDEASIRGELVALLRYANKSAIAEQLGVKPQSVINWSRGLYPSEERLRQVRRLYGLPETKEAPPAEASGALEQQIAAIMTRDEVQTMVAGIEQRVTEAINRGVTAQAEEMVDRFVDQMIEALLKRAPRLAVSDARPRPDSGSE